MNLSIDSETLKLAEAAVAEGRAVSVEAHVESLLQEGALGHWASRNREALVAMVAEAEASPPETRSLDALMQASLEKLAGGGAGRAPA